MQQKPLNSDHQLVARGEKGIVGEKKKFKYFAYLGNLIVYYLQTYSIPYNIDFKINEHIDIHVG